MRKLLYILLTLLGFVVSTSCRVMYGSPEVEYDENAEYNPDSTERLE